MSVLLTYIIIYFHVYCFVYSEDISNLPMGSLVGMALCVNEIFYDQTEMAHQSAQWFTDAVGYCFLDRVELQTPIQMTGGLSVQTIDETVRREIMRKSEIQTKLKQWQELCSRQQIELRIKK